jgi:site-specific DNA-adenine methylase
VFSYYGSKSKVVHLYPKPKFGKIIEPFAGSARYSLKYFDCDVLLVDKFETIVRTWRYLQQASEKDILGLPRLTQGLDISTLNLSEEERLFVGFMAGVAQGKPAKRVTPFAAVHFDESRKSLWVTIAEQLYKIRHWTIIQGDYQDILNEQATWFIDPPYQHGGEHQYRFGNKQLDFQSLSEWCKSRDGQAIVCENTKADWLPFYPLRKIQGVANTDTIEAIWSNCKHDYMATQPILFTQASA